MSKSFHKCLLKHLLNIILTDLLDESKTNWEETKKELTEEINDIKERNEFKDVELETQKNSNGKTSLLGGRLIITKSIRNDQRIVQPKKENGKSKEDDEGMKILFQNQPKQLNKFDIINIIFQQQRVSRRRSG